MWKAITRNSAVSLLQFVFAAAIVFVMTPIYLGALGDYDYGIWQIIAALLGYANILDLGMQPTVSRYVARYVGMKAEGMLGSLFATSFSMLLALSAVPLCAFLIFAFAGAQQLAPSAEDVTKYQWVTVLVAAAIPVTFGRFVYVSFLEGLQRYELRVLVSITHGILFAAAFFVLQDWQDPLMVMAGLSVAVGLLRVLSLHLCLRLAAPVRLRFLPRLFDRELAREMFRFGGKSFVQGVSTTIESRVDTLIVGAGLGPAVVPFYSLPQTLALYIRNLGWTLSHAFMPALSHLAGSGAEASMNDVFVRGSRYVVAAVLPLSLGIGLFGTDFIALWVGADYVQDASLLVWTLSIYFFLPFLFPLQSRYLTALDKHGIFAMLYPFRAAANIALSLALMPRLGLVGVAIGSLVPEAIVLVPVARRLLAVSGLTFWAYARSVWVPSLLPAAALVFVAVLCEQRVGTATWQAFLLTVGIVGALYLLCALLALAFVERVGSNA